MTKRKYGLIALVIGCFATISFVNQQKVQATGTVIKNRARIDNKYPMSASSDFIMVAGNQYIQSTEAFSGRIMANSMILKEDYFNFNGSQLNGDTKNDSYFEHLANPAVIINDFNKSTPENMKNILFQLTQMWKTDKDVGTGLSNNTQFATDTTRSEVEDKFGADFVPKGYLPGYTFKNLWETKLMKGTEGSLENLIQYQENGVNKYKTSTTRSDGDYSLQQNIQDVSDAYASLTPLDGKDSRDFWTNTDQIIDYKEKSDDNQEKTNPVYLADKIPDVTDVVVNITAKADKLDNDEENPKEYIPSNDGKRNIVAVSIDRSRLTKANIKPDSMNIVFNFSDSFYKKDTKTGERLLDTDKIPYIIVNYYNFKSDRFKFGAQDGYFLGDSNHREFPGAINQLGTYIPSVKRYYAKSIATELGGASADDWENSNVLNFGSHLLNNFTDANDTDINSTNDPDKSGLTADTAAVSYNNRSKGTMLFGTMLVAQGSYYAGGPTSGLYVGGVVAANNITLNAAKISPNHDKAVFGTNQDFPGIVPTTPDPTIDSIDLNDPGSNNSQSLKSGGTAKFDYADGALKPAPSLGITGELKLSNVPDSYGLYYRYNRNGNNDKGDWRRYSDGAQTGTSVELDQESLLADLNNQTKATAGTMKTEAQKISYPLTKTSGIEFATTADAKAATIAADKIETTATFKFTLQIDASLEVTVPAKISFGTDILGHSSGEAIRTVAINEIQLTQKTVADTGAPEEPKVVVYNPLLSGFNLKLAYLDANATSQNPFYITGNFKYYNINLDKSGSLASDETNGEWIDGILKRDTTPQSLETKMSNNPLKSSSLQLHLPYRNDYKVSSNAYTAPMGWQLTL
ncbi:hypothetical protein [Latilactobacillus sakei]|uniref:hypothetical protein n=1 Tax=Latilactobacillus sakei TaxID=1599 RepID=UPI001CFA696F|nr:hypothetical protein [Latilactobacillus sakei]MCB4410170.1 hypothetical protein [Latilactobacillus sakei]